MIVTSKNKRVQPLFISDLAPSAGDILFVGSVSTIVDDTLEISIPEIEVAGDSELQYQILPDNEVAISDTIQIDPPSDKGD